MALGEPRTTWYISEIHILTTRLLSSFTTWSSKSRFVRHWNLLVHGYLINQPPPPRPTLSLSLCLSSLNFFLVGINCFRTRADVIFTDYNSEQVAQFWRMLDTRLAFLALRERGLLGWDECSSCEERRHGYPSKKQESTTVKVERKN